MAAVPARASAVWGSGLALSSISLVKSWLLFLPQFPLKASLLTSGESTPRL